MPSSPSPFGTLHCLQWLIFLVFSSTGIRCQQFDPARPEVYTGVGLGGAGTDRARGGLAIDPVSGHVYLGIQYDATFTYGGVTAPVPQSGSFRFGIIRFDSTGINAVDSGWETRAVVVTTDYLWAMAVDPTAAAGAPYGIIVVTGAAGAGSWGWGPNMTMPLHASGTSFVMAIPLSNGILGSPTSMNDADPLWVYYNTVPGSQSSVLVDTARGVSYWGIITANSVNNTIHRPPGYGGDIPTFCPPSSGIIGAAFKFITATGAIVWKQCLIPSSNSAYLCGMAIDSQGYLALTGAYGGNSLLSNGVAIAPIARTATTLDGYAVGVNPHGVTPVVNWGIRIYHTGGATLFGRRVEFDQFSNVFVQVGTSTATAGAIIKAGTGSRMNITFTGIDGSNSPIVIKLSNSTGRFIEPEVQWITAIVRTSVTYTGGNNPDQIVADRTTGDLYYLGQMQSTALTVLKNTIRPGIQTDVALGSELIGPAVPSGGDAYAMRLNGTTGVPSWQVRIGSEAVDTPRDARQHPDGRVFTAGDYSGTFNISTTQSLGNSKSIRVSANSGDLWFASFSDVPSRPTCTNGGVRIDYGQGNFTCTCPVGTQGELCQTNVNDCASVPCQHGGSCTDIINGFTCSCATGYTGLLCDTNINECGSQPCENGGTCQDSADNAFTCVCATGFIGVTCQTNIDDCASGPCQNGATCVDGVDSFSCLCETNFGGVWCQSRLELCASLPCQNGGTCTGDYNSFTCACPVGFTGVACQTDIDECASSPCRFSATCVDRRDGFTCDCRPGFSGSMCEIEPVITIVTPTYVRPSAFIPPTVVTVRYANGTLAVNAVINLYVWDVVAATSRYISNGAIYTFGFRTYTNVVTTNPLVSGRLTYFWRVAYNVLGATEIRRYQYIVSPLPANITFVSVDNSIWIPYSSITATCGIAGSVTARLTDYDGVALVGQVVSTIVGDSILCSAATDSLGYVSCSFQPNDTYVAFPFVNATFGGAGFYGGTSQTIAWGVRTADLSTPTVATLDPTTCRSLSFATTMTPGFKNYTVVFFVASPTGSVTVVAGTTNSSGFVSANLTSPDLVSNGTYWVHAQTIVGGCTQNSTSAVATVVNCINYCDSVPCLNSGTCTALEGGFTCVCASGFAGVTCQTDTNECASSPCANGGSCVEAINEYACVCVAGYSGRRCETEVNECGSLPCQNSGTCVDRLSGYECTCPIGVSGAHCQTNINECTSDPCMNGATCLDGPDQWTCTCASGYTGVACQTDINECGAAPCIVPSSNVYSFEYATLPCYTVNGNPCNPRIVMLAGAVNRINVNVPAIHPVRIQDVYGFGGRIYSGSSQSGGVASGAIDVTIPAVGFPTELWFWCELHPDKFGNISIVASPVCTDHVGNHTCQCTPGTIGDNCQTRLNACESSPCQHGSTCSPMLDSYICTCTPGWGGANCESAFNITFPCTSLPCQNLGLCVANTTDDTYTCWCTPGVSGAMCQTNIDECGSAPCLGGGTCVDQTNGFACLCAAGYSGSFCQTEIDECGSSPCANGGTCTDSLTGYQCACALGFSGSMCQTDVNECASQPCANGASCLDLPNGFSCVCAAGWSGGLCQTDVDECASRPCANGGSCVDATDRYSCVCPPGYSGLLCQTDSNDCASRPCRNDGTCVDLTGGFRCDCATGFVGEFCQTNENDCASAPCLNGGSCEDYDGYYTCVCPGVVVGDRCQYLDACGSTPCPPPQVCSILFGQANCACPSGFGGGSSCREAVFAPGPISGQGNWTVGAGTPAGFVANVQVNKTLAKEGLGFLYLSGQDMPANTTASLYTPAFDKTTGDPSIQSLLTGGQFYGGNTYNHSLWSKPIGEVPDGSSVVGEITSDIQNTTVFRVELTYVPTGMNITGGNETIVVDPAVYHLIEVAAIAINGTGTTRGIVTVDRRVLYDGVFVDAVSPPPPMNQFRFVVRSSSGGGGAGFIHDLLTERVYDTPQVAPNNVYQTGFNLGPCYQNVTDPCLNNGQCVPNVINVTCVCSDGFYGPTCAFDVDECASFNPCYNGATCINRPGGFECNCTDAYRGARCTDTACAACDVHANCTTDSGAGNATCVCLPGYEGSGLTCQACSPGDASSDVSGGVCLPCSPGRYASENASAVCSECAVNTFNPFAGAAECTNCGAGTYQPDTGGTSCVDGAASSTGESPPSPLPDNESDTLSTEYYILIGAVCMGMNVLIGAAYCCLQNRAVASRRKMPIRRSALTSTQAIRARYSRNDYDRDFDDDDEKAVDDVDAVEITSTIGRSSSASDSSSDGET